MRHGAYEKCDPVIVSVDARIERLSRDWRRCVSYGSSLYERKVCTKQLYTRYVIAEIHRDERMNRVLNQGGFMQRKTPNQTTNHKNLWLRI